MRFLTVLVAALAIAGACKSSSSGSSKDSARALPAAPVATAPSDSGPAVPVFEVDGKTIEVGAIGDDIALLSLTTLPDIGSWTSIIARSTDGKEFQGASPRLLTGTRTMKLVRLPAGYEFRVMDTREGGAYVRHRLRSVAHIGIFTKGYTPPATPAGITLKTAAGEVAISSEQLASIPRSPEPNGEEERDTWAIRDVLKNLGGGDTATIVLSDAAGEEVVLDQAALGDPALLHILKRNQRGEFNFRVWKLGDSPSKQSQRRGVIRIELR